MTKVRFEANLNQIFLNRNISCEFGFGNLCKSKKISLLIFFLIKNDLDGRDEYYYEPNM